MTNPIAKVIGAIDTRLKRLEENIGSVTDVVLNFMSLEEAVDVADTYAIYKQDINTTFIIGDGIIGETLIGDRISAPVLLRSG